MGLLSSSDLASMQACVSSAFSDLAVIMRLSRESDGAGGWTTTLNAVTQPSAVLRAGALYGRLSRKHSKLSEVAAGQVREGHDALLYLPYGADVLATDVVSVCGADWDVEGVDAGQGDLLEMIVRLTRREA